MKKELDVVNGGQSPEKTAKAYRIRIVQSPDIDWDSVAAADICEYVWGGTYRPAAQARLVFVSGDGFYARLNCREASPRKALSKNDDWSVTVRIGIEDLKKLTGLKEEMLVPGYTFWGNFYKCGDDTSIPHYGSWNPIALPAPDFHCPVHFGTLILGEQ